MRVRVTQRSQPVVVLLPCCIPQRQLDMLPVHLDVRNVILKHRRHIHLPHMLALANRHMSRHAPQGTSPLKRRSTGRSAAPNQHPVIVATTEKTNLSAGTIADNDELSSDFRHGVSEGRWGRRRWVGRWWLYRSERLGPDSSLKRRLNYRTAFGLHHCVCAWDYPAR